MSLNEGHVVLAREIALQSQCVRRKYGALITNGLYTIVNNNQRVSRCCSKECVRDKLNIAHGDRTDLGAEVHAEQAALIRWDKPIDKHTKILIQGFYRDEKEPYHGIFLYPCHACARMLKFAGFKEVYLTMKGYGDELFPVSIEEILEYWEQ